MLGGPNRPAGTRGSLLLWLLLSLAFATTGFAIVYEPARVFATRPAIEAKVVSTRVVGVERQAKGGPVVVNEIVVQLPPGPDAPPGGEVAIEKKGSVDVTPGQPVGVRFNAASGAYMLDYELRKLLGLGAFTLLLAIGIALACLREVRRPRHRDLGG